MHQRHKLKIAVARVLGAASLAGISLNASAVNFFDVGAVAAPASVITTTGSALKRSWTDYGTVNRGWTHTASFYTFQLGSTADILAGNRFDVSIDVLGGGASGLANPAFSVWTSGTTATANPYASNVGYGHHWSQVRGAFDGGIGGNPCAGGVNNCSLGSNGWMASDFTANGRPSAGNILVGHDGFIGYANAGYSFKNGDNDYVQGRLAGASNPNNLGQYGNGGTGSVGGPAAGTSFTNVNTSSPWVVGGNASLAAGDATLALLGLKAGYYLIGIGGSCPDNNLNGVTCSNPPGGTNFQLTIANQGVSSVPLPSAAWLFASAAMGYLGIQRKRSTQSA